jgi:hypothetical protein
VLDFVQSPDDRTARTTFSLLPAFTPPPLPPSPLFFQIEGKGRPGRPGRPVLAEIKGSRGCPGRPGAVRTRPQIGNRVAILSTSVNQSGTPKHWRASPAANPTGKFTVSTSEFHPRTSKRRALAARIQSMPGRTTGNFTVHPVLVRATCDHQPKGGWGETLGCASRV